MKTFAEIIAKRRKQLRYSASHVSLRIGRTAATYHKIEQGKTVPRLDVAISICRVLWLDPSFVFTRMENRQP